MNDTKLNMPWVEPYSAGEIYLCNQITKLKEILSFATHIQLKNGMAVTRCTDEGAHPGKFLIEKVENGTTEFMRENGDLVPFLLASDNSLLFYHELDTVINLYQAGKLV